MIVKVDYDQSVWDYNTVNNESSRQRMTIMPADNKYSEYNEDGDLYPYNGNTSFTDDSRPAAKSNTGLKLGNNRIYRKLVVGRECCQLYVAGR